MLKFEQSHIALHCSGARACVYVCLSVCAAHIVLRWEYVNFGAKFVLEAEGNMNEFLMSDHKAFQGLHFTSM